MSNPNRSNRIVSRLARTAPAALTSLTLFGLLAACGSDETESPTVNPDLRTSEIALRSFASCAALDTHLTDLLVENYVRSYTGNNFFGPPEMDAGAPGADDGGGARGPDSYTGTNNQESGVDEPDLIKTNGTHMFIVENQTLRILQSFPPTETAELATMDLPGWGEWMFLAGDRLVVLRQIYGYDHGGWEDGRTLPPGGSDGDAEPSVIDFNGVRAMIIDIADPSDPRLVQTIDIEGSFTQARMVGGQVYLVTNHDAYNYGYDSDLYERINALGLPEFPWNGTQEARDRVAAIWRGELRPLFADYVSTTGRSRLLPDFQVDGAGRRDLVSCENVLYPTVEAGTGMLSVTAINPAGNTLPAASSVLANGWQVYGSLDALYIAQDSRWWWWTGGGAAETETHIHRFTLGGGKPAYNASGSVPGWLLNQFSMSEYDGHLRVATTDAADWGWGGVAVGLTEADAGAATAKRVVQLPTAGGQANNVFVLRQDAGSLDIVGGIRGIAETERIYAVRFMGERAYVVTFRQTDPLFTIDLSNPEEPQILGELHIPGFSTYLHPLGDSHLIGVGRDGTDDGMVLGMQLQIFDISDDSNPIRTHQEVLSGDDGWSWSEAENNHLAFTYYPEYNLLAVPVTLTDARWDARDYNHFSGVVVYRVSIADGFTEIGRISHSGMAHDRYCGEGSREGGFSCESYDYPWWVSMRRAAFIDNYLFAISNLGVTVSNIDSLSTVDAEISF